MITNPKAGTFDPSNVKEKYINILRNNLHVLLSQELWENSALISCDSLRILFSVGEEKKSLQTKFT